MYVYKGKCSKCLLQFIWNWHKMAERHAWICCCMNIMVDISVLLFTLLFLVVWGDKDVEMCFQEVSQRESTSCARIFSNWEIKMSDIHCSWDVTSLSDEWRTLAFEPKTNDMPTASWLSSPCNSTHEYHDLLLAHVSTIAGFYRIGFFFFLLWFHFGPENAESSVAKWNISPLNF